MESEEIEKTEPRLVYQDFTEIDELEYPELYLGDEFLAEETEQRSSGNKLRKPIKQQTS